MFPNPSNVTKRNRERLLDAAVEVFMEDGYQASLDKIVARAGVVKQTLYNHFGCKDALFAEVVRRATGAIVVTLAAEPDDIHGTLTRFAKALRAAALAPHGIAMFRVLVAEAPRFASLAQTAYEEGVGRAHEQLAAYLDRAMQAGRLRRDDPQVAASMLIGLLVSDDRNRCLFGIQDPPADPQRAAKALVECFLRAFAPSSEHNNA